MKIQALTRSAAAYQAPGSNIQRQSRNHDPAQHPFERAREYTRALNATKLERMFAKPFVGQLGAGHVDGVYSMAQDPGSLERLASGSGDGVVKVWDLPTRDEVWQAKPHANIVKGLCWTAERKLLSCSATDRTIALHDPYNSASGAPAAATYGGGTSYTGLSQHRAEPVFAASSAAGVALFDTSRPTTQAVQTLAWPSAVDTVTSVAFNQVETSILASTASDRSIVLYDLRTSSPLAKTTLSLSCNALAWNPMEAFNFAAASEDHNVYVFDARRLDRALNVLKGHVAAVMDVSFSPTGEGLVTASYDRTLRLWARSAGHARDVYHTQRMQRVFSASWTPDAAFVLSGSDDGNVRVWRAEASRRRGVVSARQRQSLEYGDALKERYQHMPEIRRIARHRHVPSAVKKAGDIKREELGALKRRAENRRKHERKTAGRDPRRSEREKMVVAVEE